MVSSAKCWKLLALVRNELLTSSKTCNVNVYTEMLLTAFSC